jgi:hypothetical protein
MAALVAAIHVPATTPSAPSKSVDARVMPGHDGY